MNPSILFCRTHYRNLKDGSHTGHRTSAVDWWRVVAPYEALKARGWDVDIRLDIIDADDNCEAHFNQIGSRYNVVYSSYHASGVAMGWLELIRKKYGTHYVMDIDDDLFHLQPGNLVTKQYADDPQSYARQLAAIDLAEHLNTTNHYLKDTLRKESKRKRIHVVPNYIDLDTYVPIEKKPHDKVIIGFMGTHSHSIDMVYSPLLEAMKVLLLKYPGKVEFHILGLMEMEGITDLPGVIHQQGSSDFYEYIEMWKEWTSKVDIGIAPLVDTHFNRGKSNIKPFEYGAASIPTVASAVRQYNETITHGKDGFLCATTGEWLVALEALVLNEQLRKTIGNNMLTTIKDKHTIQGNINKWEQLFQNIYEHPHHKH